MRAVRFGWVLLGLAGCAPTEALTPYTPQGAVVVAEPARAAGAPLSAQAAAQNFRTVVARVEPVAEAYCRNANTVADCDFRILVDERADQEANAYQGVDAAGHPTITFTLALIADARNQDELAFVMGHEAAHHIAGHIPLKQQSALAGAVLGGLLATAAGMDAATVQQISDLGAGVGAASYSKDYELQADAIGTEIAWRAGYDPMRGMAFFDRIPDPGDEFLGSHPANAQRKQVVAEVMAGLTGR